MTDRPGPGGPGRRPVLAALLLAGTGLSGCARLPTSGPVTTQPSVTGQPVDRPVPQPPRSGSSPARLVDDFLRASAIGQQYGFVAADAFFDADSRVTWDPDSEIVLYTSRRLVVVSGPGESQDEPPGRRPTTSPSGSGGTPAPERPAQGATAQVDVRLLGVLGTVDRAGRLVLAGEGEEQRRTFRLRASQGEWRITEVQLGLALTTDQWVSGGYYRPTPLYYPDPTGRWLVPDVRYLRHGSEATPTFVVSALLAGPAPWLAPAVTSPRPAPELKLSSVPVTNGVAAVDLTKAALTLDETVQADLRVQLRESLRETAPVTDVQLTVDGQPVAGPTPGAAGADPARTGRSDPRPASAARAGSAFVAVDAKARVVVGDVTALRVVEGLQLAGGSRPAMSYSAAGRAYALVVTGRDPAVRTLKVAEGTAPPVDVASAPDLVTPSFDGLGWVWTSPRRAAGALVAGIPLSGGVRTVSVDAPWLDGGQVVALRVSREGARVVVAVDSVAADGRRRTRILLAGIVRDASGQPRRLTDVTPLVPDLVRATDVAWLGDRTVVVLGTRRRDDKRLVVQPWLVDVGGDPTDQGIVPTADLGQIVTGADGKPLASLDAWERLAPDAAPTLAVGDGLTALYVGGARGDVFWFRPSGSWEGYRLAVFRPSFPG